MSVYCIHICFLCISSQHADGRYLSLSANGIQRFPFSVVGVVQVTKYSIGDVVISLGLAMIHC